MTSDDYTLHRDDHIRSMLDHIAKSDQNIKKAIEQVGYPKARVRDHSFTTLLNVIVGQQLSTKAAATIAKRVHALMDDKVSPKAIMNVDDAALRGAGLSRQKVVYTRSLAEAVTSKALDLSALPHMPDGDAVAAITQVKGLGRWSAEIYLMFAVGRTNLWPVDDLAVRHGIAAIIGGEQRPNAKTVEKWGKRWHPYRSTVALLSWHYYSNPPLQ